MPTFELPFNLVLYSVGIGSHDGYRSAVGMAVSKAVIAWKCAYGQCAFGYRLAEGKCHSSADSLHGFHLLYSGHAAATAPLRNVDTGMDYRGRAAVSIWMNVDMNVWAEKIKALPMVTEVIRPAYWPLLGEGLIRRS